MPVTFRSFIAEDADTGGGALENLRLLRPWNNPGKDIERKLLAQPELFVVAHDEKPWSERPWPDMTVIEVGSITSLSILNTKVAGWVAALYRRLSSDSVP